MADLKLRHPVSIRVLPLAARVLALACVGWLVGDACAIPAFPGAEGAGAHALGGRGGDVYYVTTLANSGAGSLRDAISTATGPRTILFKVSGNIVLSSSLNLNKSRITIAGQTAPGDGICLQNFPLNISGSDIVVRHIRSRLGTNALQETDAISITAGTNIIVDHCSASWSVDETLSATHDAYNVTVQWCFITESLNNSIHSKGAHGYGSLIGPRANTTYSWHHNLYAHHNSRSPRLGSAAGATFRLDFRNNVLYNWGNRAGYSGGSTEFTEMNYVGNYLVAGPNKNYNYAFQGGATTTVIYQSDNRMDLTLNGVLDGVNNGWGMFSGSYSTSGSPFSAPAVATDPPGVAYQRVLSSAGALPWRRDGTDRRVTDTVRRLTGQIIDSTAQVGGWPLLSSTAPPVDSDSDGMPDYWELAMGLNVSNAADRNHTDAIGYTRLEEYLNWLAEPHALCHRNGQVDVNLRELNGGLTNLTFSVTSGTNGTVSLLADGFTARFVPAPNYSGRASFTFTATDPASSLSFGPVAAGVLVTTTNTPNTSPALSPVPDQALTAGEILAFTAQATDTDQPPQALTFSLENAPPGAVIGAGDGDFHWRPDIAQGGTTNALKIIVTDNGTPSLSATQSFTVTVRTPSAPSIQSVGTSNGTFGFRVFGDSGPDYCIQTSSNLLDWTNQFTTNQPSLPFWWFDSAVDRVRFYRIRLAP